MKSVFLPATVIIYNLVKKFGKPLVDAFVPEDKFKKFKFLHDEKKLELIVFIILMIPGTPKDVISYMTSLTDINRYRFYFIATPGQNSVRNLVRIYGSDAWKRKACNYGYYFSNNRSCGNYRDFSE